MLQADRLLPVYHRALRELGKGDELGHPPLLLSPAGRYIYPDRPHAQGWLLDTETLQLLKYPYRSYGRAQVFDHDRKLLLVSDAGLETFTLPDLVPELQLQPHAAELRARQQARADADDVGISVDYSPIDLHGAASADGKYLASYWEALQWFDATGLPLGTAPVHWCRALAISGDYAACAAALETFVCRVPEGTTIARLPTAEQLQFCPEQPGWLAQQNGSTLHVYQLPGGQKLYEATGVSSFSWWGSRLLLRIGSKLSVRHI